MRVREGDRWKDRERERSREKESREGSSGEVVWSLMAVDRGKPCTK